MMYKKAELFSDLETAKKILESTSPAKQKKLGRQVKGFDQQIWDQHCKQIVYEGNYAKFTQNPDLKKEELLKTKRDNTCRSKSRAEPDLGCWVK